MFWFLTFTERNTVNLHLNLVNRENNFQNDIRLTKLKKKRECY